MPRLLIFLALIFLTNGCSLHTIRPPEVPASTPAGFQDEGHKSGLELDRWWQSFADPQLNQLMEKAFTENLDIQQAASRWRQAQIMYRQSHSSDLPTVTFNGSAGRQKIMTSMGSSIDNSFAASLSAGYEIDLWQKLASTQKAAGFRQQATHEEIRALYLSLSAQIAQLWYQRQEKAIHLQRLNEITALYKDRLKQVESQYAHGLVDATVLYQARQALDMASIQRPSLETAVAEIDNSLALLCGSWAGTITPENLKQLPEITESFPLGLPADLLKKRPDVAASFARLQAADAEIATAVANRFPSIQLTASYGRQGNDLIRLLDPDYTFWNFIAGLTQPVFDAGRRKRDVAYKKEVYAEQLITCKKSMMLAFSDVSNALNAEHAADAVIRLHKQRLQSSLDNLKLTRMRYEQGLSGYLDLSLMMIQYMESEIAQLSANLQRITARISLAKALGGNWMEEEIQHTVQKQDKKS